MHCKPIIVVAGEPYSVFLEIFFKAKKNHKFKNPIILIVSKKLLLQQMKSLMFFFKINIINENDINFKNLKNNKINIIDVNFSFKKTFDKISNKSNVYINKCFDIALKVIANNDCLGLINGAISKQSFLNKKFLGITEYLGVKTKNVNLVMLIYNKKLSVSPLTTHLPLKDVHTHITKKKILDHVKLINKFYKRQFNKTPRIAITGLNPHCESNHKLSEEDKVINPAITDLINKRYDVEGPFAADTIFMKENSKKYDVIIGMYHDQVLTPIKTLFGFDAINITLGLPFIRISPDHGPNATMLGKNLSNPKSLIQALKFLDR
jgi:4-hydroxythreonine-4-phosphate dehydrogenase